MTSHPRPPGPPSDEAGDGEMATSRHLARLLRQHDRLARLAIEQNSHQLSEYSDTISLLTIVENELLAWHPSAYDALLPVWLTRNTYVGHEPGKANPACSICSAQRPVDFSPTPA